MIIIDDLENKMQKHALAFQELTIKIDHLNQEVTDLLAELNISAEQLTTFMENKQNFSEENWQTITKQKQEMEDRLTRELANIRNPIKNKKAYADRLVPQHWLFVR